jgi:anti-sigma factor RsiW
MSPRAPELTCQQLVELVTDYFEDGLAPADRARFEAHVAGCPGCDAYLEQMRTTLEVVGATAALESRPEVLAVAFSAPLVLGLFPRSSRCSRTRARSPRPSGS